MKPITQSVKAIIWRVCATCAFCCFELAARIVSPNAFLPWRSVEPSILLLHSFYMVLQIMNQLSCVYAQCTGNGQECHAT